MVRLCGLDAVPIPCLRKVRVEASIPVTYFRACTSTTRCPAKNSVGLDWPLRPAAGTHQQVHCLPPSSPTTRAGHRGHAHSTDMRRLTVSF